MNKMSNKVKKVSKGNGKRKAAVIALCALVLLLASIVSAGFIYINSKLDLIHYDNNEEWVAASDSDYEGDTEFEAIGEDAEVNISEDEVYKDDNVMNILLLGTDERGKKFTNKARSDAILVLSLNKKTNEIHLVSLERGMAVKMPNGKVDYLTHAFRYGGPQWVIECVRTHLKLDVEKYIRVNFHVFEELIDAVGGVDIKLTSVEAAALNQEVHTNTAELSRRVHAGNNHLNGFEALQYCRLRYTDSDFVRIQRQRKTIAAIQKQCRDLSVSEINSAADAVLPMVQTNLEKSEILSLMTSIPQFLDSDIADMTIPAEGTFKNLAKVDYEANTAILREFLYGISGDDQAA